MSGFRQRAKALFKLPRCRQMRHWFVYYGDVGSSRPTCSRCGAPNPYLDRDDLANFDYDEYKEWQAALEKFNIPIPVIAS